MTLTKTWADGEVLYAADLNQNFKESENWITPFCASPLNPTGIAVHSSSKWSVIDSSGTIWQTADTGVTWTSKSTTCDTTSFLVRCRDDPTKAFACETTSTSECTYTSNSGDSWTAKTSISFTTAVYCASFPTANLIVVGGSAGTNQCIQYSTNQGTTWNTSASTFSAYLVSVSMLDGTTGYAVDHSNNIYKTTDGAVTWSDTTHNTYNISDGAQILTLTSSISVFTSSSAEYYDNTTNTTKLIGAGNIGAICKTTNGNIYITSMDSSTYVFNLYRSTDNGVNWSVRTILNSSSTASPVSKCGLDNDGNNLIIAMNGGINKVIKLSGPQ